MFPYLSTCPYIEESQPVSTDNENTHRILNQEKACLLLLGRRQENSSYTTHQRIPGPISAVMPLWSRPCTPEAEVFFSFSHFFFFFSLLFYLTSGRTVISRMSLPRLKVTETSKTETGPGNLPSLPVPCPSPSANNCLKDKMADLCVAQLAKVEQGQWKTCVSTGWLLSTARGIFSLRVTHGDQTNKNAIPSSTTDWINTKN